MSEEQIKKDVVDKENTAEESNEQTEAKNAEESVVDATEVLEVLLKAMS